MYAEEEDEVDEDEVENSINQDTSSSMDSIVFELKFIEGERVGANKLLARMSQSSSLIIFKP
jgi:hypothetical protein